MKPLTHEIMNDYDTEKHADINKFTLNFDNLRLIALACTEELFELTNKNKSLGEANRWKIDDILLDLTIILDKLNTIYRWENTMFIIHLRLENIAIGPFLKHEIAQEYINEYYDESYKPEIISMLAYKPEGVE